ncbi:MAG: GntR family transcriptional regulator [Synechococcales cyanobacterium]
MLPRLFIHPSREVSVVTQLVSQISFAIANGQVLPGEQLPSLRQLAQHTGLHRNSIAKVYQQLAAYGLIETREGSGVYVRSTAPDDSSTAHTAIQSCLSTLVEQGYNASQIREMVLGLLDWQIQCRRHVVISVPRADLGIAEMIQSELASEMQQTFPLVVLEELPDYKANQGSLTILTTRYFLPAVTALAGSQNVIPLEINPFTHELQQIQALPVHSGVGIVSRSAGLLQSAQAVLEGLRGDDLLVLTALSHDTEAIRTVIRRAKFILVDATSWDPVQAQFRALRSELWQQPQIQCCPNYLHPQSVARLRQQLQWIEG